MYTIQKSNRLKKQQKAVFRDERKDVHFGDSRHV